MLKSAQATCEWNGEVHVLAPLRTGQACRGMVMLLDDPDVPETVWLSEDPHSRNGKRPEEDAAWSLLQ